MASNDAARLFERIQRKLSGRRALRRIHMFIKPEAASMEKYWPARGIWQIQPEVLHPWSRQLKIRIVSAWMNRPRFAAANLFLRDIQV